MCLKNGNRISIKIEKQQRGEGKIIVINDVTDEHNYLESINRQERLESLGNMVARLAHQVRTPLTAAFLYTSSLEKQTKKQELSYQLIENIKHCLHSLEQTVNDMLSYAKGEWKLNDIVDLKTLIKDLRKDIKTEFGKYSGEFLSLGVGGRALGMGGAYVAVTDDVTSGYWNPAGLARMNYPQISLMHEEHFGSLVNYNYGAVAIPYGPDMSFGISAIRLSIDGIPDTRNALIDRQTGQQITDPTNVNWGLDYSKITEFSNTDWAFFLTFAKKQTENFYWGANVKFIRRDIAEFGATGIGFDVGAIYIPYENLTVGANIMDLTTTLLAWDTGRNELIAPTLKVGSSYKLNILGGSITPAVDFDIRFEDRRSSAYFNLGPISLDTRMGMEYNFKNIIAIRGGYNDVDQFTIGAGIKLPKLNIDYTYATFRESETESLPDTHRISLILTLEEPKFLRSSE